MFCTKITCYLYSKHVLIEAHWLCLAVRACTSGAVDVAYGVELLASALVHLQRCISKKEDQEMEMKRFCMYAFGMSRSITMFGYIQVLL